MAGTIERAWHERRKVIIATINVKYAILRDRELKPLLAIEKEAFFKANQLGETIEELSIKRLLKE